MKPPPCDTSQSQTDPNRNADATRGPACACSGTLSTQRHTPTLNRLLDTRASLARHADSWVAKSVDGRSHNRCARSGIGTLGVPGLRGWGGSCGAGCRFVASFAGLLPGCRVGGRTSSQVIWTVRLPGCCPCRVAAGFGCCQVAPGLLWNKTNQKCKKSECTHPFVVSSRGEFLHAHSRG